MSCWAVIVAAGQGTRMGGSCAKVMTPLLGKPLLAWTLAPFAASARIDGLCAVTTPPLKSAVRELLEETGKPYQVVMGGASRGESVRAGLFALPEDARWVAVHDGARPCLRGADLERLLDTLFAHGSAVAGYPARDTLQGADEEGRLKDSPRRERLWTVQTPQCFALSPLRDAYARAEALGQSFTDEAGVMDFAGQPVRLVETASDNLKLTVPSDLPLIAASLTGALPRVGTGYDAHRLIEGRPLVLGGVTVPFEKGLEGHSDADVLTHALMDALLGAAALGDIGQHFPPEDPAYLNADSLELLKEVMELLRQAGLRPVNADVTVVAQRPKLAPYRPAMREKLARILELPPERVSVKATTTEGMGFEGRGEGISAQAVVCVTESSFYR